MKDPKNSLFELEDFLKVKTHQNIKIIRIFETPSF